MATLIRNASNAGKEKVDVRASKICEEIARILKEEAFIESYKRIDDNKQGKLRIYLRLNDEKKPSITNIKRISKPGLRVYKGTKEITPVLGGLGISVISTSQGLIVDKDAREKKLGGEVVLEVW